MKLHAACLSIAIAATPAVAAVSYETQARSVTGYEPGASFDTHSAADFLTFNATALAISSNSTATATQLSNLTSGGIFIVASAQCSNANGFAPVATSRFDVTFTLDVPTPYSAAGTLATTYGSFHVRLSQGASILWEHIRTSPGSAVVEHSGLLPAGTYRLEANIDRRGPVFGPGPATTMNVSLLVPAPGTTAALGSFALIAGMRRRR